MTSRLSNLRFLLTCLICATLAGLIFIPGLHGGFIFDDEPNIVSNQAIHLRAVSFGSLRGALFGVQPSGTTRILPTLSFALDYWRAGGPNPVVFKTTNIIIHALTTIVLAYFLRSLLTAAGASPQRTFSLAPALALAWALHPLQVSSVLYAVQRMETLATLFVILALAAYLKARIAQLEGLPGRTQLMIAGLFWVLALGCKEDAILLPAYTLSLELTVLCFQARCSALSHKLRKAYLFMVVVSVVFFAFFVVPHYWTWDNYPGRDFSTPERLLTQGRVLCRYMWEIFFPLPANMPFYYDWLAPSRGLFNPWTTLPAILFVCFLLATAWLLRTRRPLFSLGLLLFFAGHFITSNVLNLELAFEHRNHFPLLGALLAFCDLSILAWEKLGARPAAGLSACVLLLAILANGSIARARIWGSPVSLALHGTQFAQHSARAWNSLCLYYYELGGGESPGNPYLDKAIEACSEGSEAAPYSITNLTNLIVFKAKRGTLTQSDWDRFDERLRHVNTGPENAAAPWVLLSNARNGTPLDGENMLKALNIIASRHQLKPDEYAAIGFFLLGRTNQAHQAFWYFARAVQTSAPKSPLLAEISIELGKQGRMEWVKKLENLEQKDRELNRERL